VDKLLRMVSQDTTTLDPDTKLPAAERYSTNTSYKHKPVNREKPCYCIERGVKHVFATGTELAKHLGITASYANGALLKGNSIHGIKIGRLPEEGSGE